MFSLSPCNKPRSQKQITHHISRQSDKEFKLWTVCIKCGAAWSHFSFAWNQGEVCPECNSCCAYRTQVIARKCRLWGYAGRWNLWGRVFGQKMWETVEGAQVHSLKDLFVIDKLCTDFEKGNGSYAQ